jgi:hypothetical protein
MNDKTSTSNPCAFGQAIIIVTYDAEARASYQQMSDKPVARTVESDAGLTDYAADGTLVGIEKLYA